jgi:alpha-1,2-mannosyltransferase
MQPAAKGRDGRLAQSKPMSASGPVTEYCSRPRLLARRLVEVARRRQVRRASLVACAALLGYALVRHLALHLDMVDMQVYRAEGQAVLDHRSLYAMRATRANLAATYPPFAALLFTPLAVLPVAVLRMLVTGANIGLLGVLGLLSCRFADWPGPAARPAVAVLAAGLGVWLEPMWTTLNYGQINLLLAVLVLWDLTLPDDRRHKGMAIGIAAGIKLTPALFIVYLLLSRRVRSAVVAGATALGTAVVGAVLLPGNSVAFWTKDLFDTGRVGQVWIVDNQSLRGMLARLSHTPDPGPWAVLVVAAVGALGLAVAAASARAAGRTPRLVPPGHRPARGGGLAAQTVAGGGGGRRRGVHLPVHLAGAAPRRPGAAPALLGDAVRLGLSAGRSGVPGPGRSPAAGPSVRTRPCRGRRTRP